jgi:hypothetical protein
MWMAYLGSHWTQECYWWKCYCRWRI